MMYISQKSPGVFLPASFHCQKNKSKGSHIRKIWTTFFSAASVTEKRFYLIGAGWVFDVSSCMGYPTFTIVTSRMT